MGHSSPAADDNRQVSITEDRVRTVVSELYGIAWRIVRRLGVPPGDAEDAVQQVFMVVSRKMNDIEIGSERAFVAATAVRVAADARRAARRKPLVLLPEIDEVHDTEAPDELAESLRARRLLDALIDEMPEETRDVFVLFEIEQLSLTEIARELAIPRGTVASRLARARSWFSAELERRRIPPPREGKP
jgi:RNA polymerase sigma-70 factor (ECF subfamily)